MAARFHTLSVTVVLAFLAFAHPTFSADSPEYSPPSPSPSPQLSSEDVSPSPEIPSPSPAPSVSPPAPPPSDLAPASPSPAPSPAGDDSEHINAPSPAPAVAGDDADRVNTPSPAPTLAGDVRHVDRPSDVDFEKDNSGGGMSGGKKAGVAIGVIAAGCIVGLAALVYRKRRQNIRRSQYGYYARRETL